MRRYVRCTKVEDGKEKKNIQGTRESNSKAFGVIKTCINVFSNCMAIALGGQGVCSFLHLQLYVRKANDLNDKIGVFFSCICK